MKKFVTLLLLGFISVVNATAQTVSIDDIFTNKGSEITVPVNATNVPAGVQNAQFVLEYDTSMVEVLGFTIGDIVNGTAPTPVTSNFVSNAGVGQFRFSFVADSPLKTEGSLASINIRIKNYGTSTLGLTADTRLGNLIPSRSNGELTTKLPISIVGPKDLDINSEATYDVVVGDLTGRSISNFQFVINYDNTLLTITDSDIVKGELLSESDDITKSVISSNIRVGSVLSTPLSSSGTLFSFTANSGTALGTNSFTITDVQFGDGSSNDRLNTSIQTPMYNVAINNIVEIELFPSSTSTTLNEQSTLELRPKDGVDITNEDIFNYQFVLDFPASDLRVDTVIFVDELGANNGVYSNINGKLRIASVINDNTTPFSGSGSFAQIVVTNLSKGTHTIGFDSQQLNSGDPTANTSSLELVVDNDAPSMPMITVPANGDTVKVMGLPTAEITPTWSASTDANDDELDYTWELSTSMDFSTSLLSVNVGTATSVILTNAAVENLLTTNGVTTGTDVTLYHRVMVTDGKTTVSSNGSSAVFALGVVNTPVVAGSIISPVSGDTVKIMGLPSDEVDISWTSTMINDTDDDVISYNWELSTDMNFDSVVDSFSGADTMVTRTNAQLEALVGDNDTLTVYHRVTYSDGESTASSDVEVVVFISGVVNTPPSATSITSPENNATLVVEGLPSDTVSPMWSESTDADGNTLNYSWELSTSESFESSSILVSVDADTNKSVTLTLDAIDSILSSAGLNIGDTVQVYHRANVTDGIELVEGTASTAFFIRGLVNTPPTVSEITVPTDAAEITIQGDPSAPFVPRWTESTDADGDEVSYIWQLSTSPNFSSSSILVEASVSANQVDLTVGAVAQVLDDAGVQPGIPVFLYHRAQSTDGKETVNGTAASVTLIRDRLTSLDEELPAEFSLDQNYPNPFNPVTTINYSVAESRLVSVKIYDMLGREVATLVNEVQPAGNYTVPFDASTFSTGIYIYRMVSGDFVQTRKMTLMK